MRSRTNSTILAKIFIANSRHLTTYTLFTALTGLTITCSIIIARDTVFTKSKFAILAFSIIRSPDSGQSQVELRIPSIVSITQIPSFLHSIPSHRLISKFSPVKGSLQSQLNLSAPSSSKHIPPFFGSDEGKDSMINKIMNHCTANKNCVKRSHYLLTLIVKFLGYELKCLPGKPIQWPIGEFGGMTQAVLLENSSRPFFKVFETIHHVSR